ncbi:MAG: prephenate dehydrogenase/arogenate dehydrogenase family protein [Blastochloris sp.]|nr:prephenate dehydrogenase/arogenate dehydrogenase family protein [Blastochloris sp.]
MTTPSVIEFQRLTIVGPGLLGGSIALAARELCPQLHISVWARRPETLQSVQEAGFADRCSLSLTEAVQDADLVILTTPIEVMADLAEQMRPALRPDTLVTDVGSVKESVHQALKPLLGSARWLGSHPMAGSEQSGLIAARSDLFQGSVTILTPDQDSPPELCDVISRFWTALGSRCVRLEPSRHDLLISDISHLPHLMAALLVLCVDEQSLPLAGPGFRDSTRIAAGSPTLWREILLHNRQALLQSLDKLALQASAARKLLEEADGPALEALLAKACQKRKIPT